MTIRLHEIELGTAAPAAEAGFYYQLFGWKAVVQQPALQVLDAGLGGLDFNLSTHHPQGVVVISFLTNDLAAVEQRLKENNLAYEGPLPSHLGMQCLQFNSPAGYRIRVNAPGTNSPAAPV